MKKTIAADSIRFERDPYLRLFLIRDGKCEGPVHVKRIFPLTEPDRYILIADEQGKTIGVLDELDKLTDASRRFVDEALDRAYFLPKIVHIKKIEDSLGTMIWHVETDRGPREFEVFSRRRDIRWMSDQHVVIEDADGNRYEIIDLDSLDPRSRDILEMEI